MIREHLQDEPHRSAASISVPRSSSEHRPCQAPFHERRNVFALRCHWLRRAVRCPSDTKV